MFTVFLVNHVSDQEAAEHLRFLRESHSEALKEEERRYRFLAEKHCGLIRSVSGLMNKVRVLLQNSIHEDTTLACAFGVSDCRYRMTSPRDDHVTHFSECQEG